MEDLLILAGDLSVSSYWLRFFTRDLRKVPPSKLVIFKRTMKNIRGTYDV
jgi:hypothetical protein